GEGSGTPTEPHHTPSPEAQSPSHTTHTSPTLPPVTTTSLPTVTQFDTPIVRQYTRRTRIAQSSVLPTVADEPASPLQDVSQGEACPTDSGFIADQDRATIDKSSTLPYDSAPRVTSPVADEGNMQQTILELTALCTSLQRQISELTAKFQAQEVEINRLKERVKMLEDRERVAATRSRDDAPVKRRSMDEGEAATERISDDSEEMVTVLAFMDVATVLASGVVDVPTGSGSIPTASTPAEEQVPTGSDVVPTASLVFATATVVTPYRIRKGKEVMVESETLKKQKVQEQIDAQVARELEEQLEREDQRRSEQIARDAEIVRIHAEEELQIMIDGLDRNNEIVAKYLQEYHQFASKLLIERRIELITDLVKYQDNYAKIYKYQKEAERIKKKGLNLEQESAKKQKTSEEIPEEAMSPEEVPKEKKPKRAKHPEPTKKSEHAEKDVSSKKPSRKQSSGAQIRDTPGVSVSKKKAPTTTDRSKGNGTKLGVPDVPKDQSESENESWGESRDDDDSNDDDSDDDDSDDDGGKNDASDDERTESDEDKNPNLNQNNDDIEEQYEDEYTDAGHDNVTQDTTYDQVEDDAHITLTTVHDLQKTKVPLQSSSVLSNFATQFLNLDNVLLADNEIISMMNINFHHEERSNQTPSLLTLVTVLPKTSIATAATIPPPIPPFIPPSHQSTPTPTPTPIPTTTTILILLDFSSLFEFNQRVSNLEKGLSELKQADHSAQLLSYTAEFEMEAQAEKKRYIDLIEKSVKDIINDEILIDKMEKSHSNLTTDKHKELYKALVNSYNVDKDLFLVYGKAVSLKRGREDNDKDEDPPAGSDQ
nr:hypothetical protein [Tanacetum cinerariifolium]